MIALLFFPADFSVLTLDILALWQYLKETKLIVLVKSKETERNLGFVLITLLLPYTDVKVFPTILF